MLKKKLPLNNISKRSSEVYYAQVKFTPEYKDISTEGYPHSVQWMPSWE